MRDKSHDSQVKRWAEYCKADMKECQRQTTRLVNAQIENANKFYKRLSNMPKGKEKIAEIKMI